MTTQIAKLPEHHQPNQALLKAAGIQNLKESLGSPELKKHRAMLAFELEKVSAKIDRFGWGAMSEALKDALILDWMDVLSEFPLADVQAAIKALLGSKSERHAANEAKVRAEILKLQKLRLDRAKHTASIERLPERAEITDAEKESANDILAKNGFARSCVVKSDPDPASDSHPSDQPRKTHGDTFKPIGGVIA